MKRKTYFVAAALLSGVASAKAEPSPHGEAPNSLLGIEIGATCQQAAWSLDTLRNGGFDGAAARLACEVERSGFVTEHFLADREDRTERLEVAFRPDGVVWRLKLVTTWKEEAVLFDRPDQKALAKSLHKRYGQPLAAGVPSHLQAGKGTRWTAREDMAWARGAQQAVPTGRVDGWAWDRWLSDFKGVVTTAAIFSAAERRTAALVVQVEDRSHTAAFGVDQAARAKRSIDDENAHQSSHLRGL